MLFYIVNIILIAGCILFIAFVKFHKAKAQQENKNHEETSSEE